MNKFAQKGYSRTTLATTKQLVDALPRSNLLQNKDKTNGDPSFDEVPIITRFSANTYLLRKIVNRHWDILKEDKIIVHESWRIGNFIQQMSREETKMIFELDTLVPKGLNSEIELFAFNIYQGLGPGKDTKSDLEGIKLYEPAMGADESLFILEKDDQVSEHSKIEPGSEKCNTQTNSYQNGDLEGHVKPSDRVRCHTSSIDLVYCMWHGSKYCCRAQEPKLDKQRTIREDLFDDCLNYLECSDVMTDYENGMWQHVLLSYEPVFLLESDQDHETKVNQDCLNEWDKFPSGETGANEGSNNTLSMDALTGLCVSHSQPPGLDVKGDFPRDNLKALQPEMVITAGRQEDNTSSLKRKEQCKLPLSAIQDERAGINEEDIMENNLRGDISACIKPRVSSPYMELYLVNVLDNSAKGLTTTMEEPTEDLIDDFSKERGVFDQIDMESPRTSDAIEEWDVDPFSMKDLPEDYGLEEEDLSPEKTSSDPLESSLFVIEDMDEEDPMENGGKHSQLIEFLKENIQNSESCEIKDKESSKIDANIDSHQLEDTKLCLLETEDINECNSGANEDNGATEALLSFEYNEENEILSCRSQILNSELEINSVLEFEDNGHDTDIGSQAVRNESHILDNELQIVDNKSQTIEKELLEGNESEIFHFEAEIMGNESNILDNESQIVENKSEILESESLIAKNEPLDGNESQIMEFETEFLGNELNILDTESQFVGTELQFLGSESQIKGSELQILKNESQILEDESQMGDNRSEISENQSQIVENELQSAARVLQILYNESQIKENEQLTVTNESQIWDDESQILGNELQISDDRLKIVENLSQTLHNESRIVDYALQNEENGSPIGENILQILHNESHIKENESVILKNESEILNDKSEIVRNELQILENESQIAENESQVDENASQIFHNGLQTLGNKLNIFNIESQIVDHGSQSTETELLTSDNESQIVKNESQILDYESQSTETEFRISDNESKVIKNESQILDYESQSTETEFLISDNESQIVKNESQILDYESQSTETEFRISDNESPVMKNESKILESGPYILDNGSQLESNGSETANFTSQIEDDASQILDMVSKSVITGAQTVDSELFYDALESPAVIIDAHFIDERLPNEDVTPEKMDIELQTQIVDSCNFCITDNKKFNDYEQECEILHINGGTHLVDLSITQSSGENQLLLDKMYDGFANSRILKEQSSDSILDSNTTIEDFKGASGDQNELGHQVKEVFNITKEAKEHSSVPKKNKGDQEIDDTFHMENYQGNVAERALAGCVEKIESPEKTTSNIHNNITKIEKAHSLHVKDYIPNSNELSQVCRDPHTIRAGEGGGGGGGGGAGGPGQTHTRTLDQTSRGVSCSIHFVGSTNLWEKSTEGKMVKKKFKSAGKEASKQTKKEQESLDVNEVFTPDEEKRLKRENSIEGTVPKDSKKAPQLLNGIQAELFPDCSENLKLFCHFGDIHADSTITWTKDSKLLARLHRSSKDDSPVSLAIVQTSKKDQGLYNCTLKNVHGKVVTEFHLTAEVLDQLTHSQDSEGGEEIEFNQLFFREDFISDMYFGGNLHGRIATEDLHFGEGVHRKAFRSKVMCGLLPVFNPGHLCVLKVHNAIAYGTKNNDELVQKNYKLAVQECYVQNTAREYAKIYAAEAEQLEEFGKVPEVIPIFLIHRPANNIPYATVEEELIGDFVKYSIKDGKEINVLRKDSEAGQKCCTFQHWVYERTNGNLLITDMQGVGMKLTDVGIATMGKGYKGFKGNCAVSFIDQFKALHQCNKYCEILGLQSLRPNTSKQKKPNPVKEKVQPNPSSSRKNRQSTKAKKT
ncbi:alpha-protein kinase 2 [Ranitomeya variabilis]|uniref:alpha-protein kinase 2 n=1 Tax=Ranitomeya variabilis TaxID=490064 RepID=UPI0040574638